MTRRRTKSRRSDRPRGDLPTSGRSETLFPSLSQLAEEVREAQNQFERLEADNQGLRQQLSNQGRELGEFRQQAADLKAECESLKRDIELAEKEIERSRTDALVGLFKEMGDERHNRLLRKLLVFEDEEPALLRDLSRYLREHLHLNLEGRIGDEIILSEENLDRYDLQEPIDLPCRARIIGRGILLEGQPVLRTQVEPVEEKTNDGD